MIKCAFKFLFCTLVLAASTVHAEVKNDLPTALLEKGGSFLKPRSNKERSLYLTINSFQVSGDFSFRILVNFPNGTIFKSKVFNSTSLPSTPYKLASFHSCPIGPYLVYSQVVDVRTPGAGLVILQSQNSWNHYVSAAQVFMQGDSTFLNQRLLSSALSFP